MDKERARIIDKAKKLKELADRGVDGEKETAKRMYDAYKKKHNLTDDDVKGHKYTDDFINDIKNMTDEELLEVIGKGLIILGVGLIFSLLSDSFGSKKSKAKRNSDNAKRANEMSKIFSQMNKNNKKKKEESDDDIPDTNKKEQEEIQKQIDKKLKE